MITTDSNGNSFGGDGSLATNTGGRATEKEMLLVSRIFRVMPSPL